MENACISERVLAVDMLKAETLEGQVSLRHTGPYILAWNTRINARLLRRGGYAHWLIE